MILVDPRVGSKELIPGLKRTKVRAELSPLEYGDVCFEGNGPDGRMMIGIERKALGDMLQCIQDHRYAAHQRPGMASMYQVSILMVEGVFKPDPLTGYLVELVRQLTWSPKRQYGRMSMYNNLFRYLLSVQMAGVIVIVTRDLEDTAFHIGECYYYFQKKWDDHTSQLQMQRPVIATMNTTNPSLLLKWAASLDGVGSKIAPRVAKAFKTPYDLAKADETDFVKVEGIGVKQAQKIVREIRGNNG